MKYDPDKHHRRSIRLKEYCYAQSGTYYITICIQNKLCLLGEVYLNKMILSDAGKMVAREWEKLLVRYTNCDLDQYIVMPNHLHGIIIIKNADNKNRRGESCIRPTYDANDQGDHEDRPYKTNDNKNGRGESCIRPKMHPCGPENGSIGSMIQSLKSISTSNYIKGVKEHNWIPFCKRLWQRNYFDRIIRDESELNRIRKYIVENPFKWQKDEYFSGK